MMGVALIAAIVPPVAFFCGSTFVIVRGLMTSSAVSVSPHWIVTVPPSIASRATWRCAASSPTWARAPRR
jgi:hypothetical protein